MYEAFLLKRKCSKDRILQDRRVSLRYVYTRTKSVSQSIHASFSLHNKTSCKHSSSDDTSLNGVNDNDNDE